MLNRLQCADMPSELGGVRSDVAKATRQLAVSSLAVSCSHLTSSV